MSANLFGAFQKRFTRDGDRACFIRPGQTTVTYGTLGRWSGRFASLLAKRGVRPGDRVAVQVEKSVENVVLYLACLRAGAVYLPLNTAYTDSELDYFFSDAEPSLIVCAPHRQEGIETLAGARKVRIDTLDAAGAGSLAADARRLDERFATVERASDDLAAILYTSGTTGRSKGAMITHGNLQANAETLIDIWGISSTDTLLHALPIYHVHGLFVALNTCLMSGAGVIFLPSFKIEEIIEHLPAASLMMGVPTFYGRLLGSEEFTRDLCRSMRLFVAGSAPLLEETFHRFEARTGHRILERYGMTETGMLCSNPLRGERRPGTVGPPLPDVQARIRGEDGEIKAAKQAGVIEVRGPNVFQGYWRMPEKTKEEFRDDGFFVTGDIGMIDDDGYVTIIGRAKDMIISGGFNVYPKEVEDVIDRLPGVGESAVVGLPHPDFGEAVAAVVTEDGSHPLDEAGIIASARKTLAGFKLPKAVFLVGELPRNSMGKVQKNELRKRYADTFIAET